MPKYTTTNKSIFQKKDDNNVLLSKWATPGKDEKSVCTLCFRPVQIDHGGMGQINQYARVSTHKQLSDAKFSESQPRFFKGASNVQLGKPVKAKITQAEGLWAFKLAEQDWSFRSCDGIDQLFHRMFECEKSEKFAIGRTKMSYVVRHGLGPAVLEELSADINNSIGCFTLLLDETTTAQVKKQCDFLVR